MKNTYDLSNWEQFFASKSLGICQGVANVPRHPLYPPLYEYSTATLDWKKPCAGLDHTTNGWSHIGDSRTGFFLMFSVSPCMIIIHLISINPRFLAPPPRLMFMFYSRQTNRYLISISLTLMFSFNWDKQEKTRNPWKALNFYSTNKGIEFLPQTQIF